ncbi:putative metal-binding protein [Halapricum desulfuricans]|uniref:Putative metal-binding protein n=2 Tax=Halapricum desulfuricans TaxID=2841257 RepID=A0A897NKJ2_9EURY|nr:putative metal-binding protein [Halapricum desulfuricans]
MTMKKQELIHLHGLLAQVQEHYEEHTGNVVEHDEYLDQGVRPTSIHKSKTDHKAAVFALADGLTSELESEVKEPVSASAD